MFPGVALMLIIFVDIAHTNQVVRKIMEVMHSVQRSQKVGLGLNMCRGCPLTREHKKIKKIKIPFSKVSASAYERVSAYGNA